MHQRPSRASTVVTVAGVAVVALAAGALLRWGPAPQESDAPAATVASASSATSAPAEPTTPSATSSSRAPKQSKRLVRQIRAARSAIPDRVILRQLRNAAERIARQQPQTTPVPQPTDIEPESNRALGYQLMLDFGFAADQWPALDALWMRESGWNHLAENPSSGAYGIPQSLPANKMAVVGPDWRTNPTTQIRWGLAYISARYGVPDRAWAHSERVGWY